jgi:hypothetical protein
MDRGFGHLERRPGDFSIERRKGFALARADDWRGGNNGEGVGGKPACHLGTAGRDGAQPWQ